VEAERLAQQAGAELTTLINALRPPALESKTLADAMREHAEAWSRQNNIACEIRIDSSVSISQPAEQALFRVLQEALANVARHSQASQVLITLMSENGNVALIIDDNGIGYDASQITKGIGLDSMKERLAALNGTLQVSSLQSQGTRISAIVRSQ
jgi:NarL family two-component system sensor histidine kinase LiaS